jgi:hypothetical protein
MDQHQRWALAVDTPGDFGAVIGDGAVDAVLGHEWLLDLGGHGCSVVGGMF